MARGMNRVEQAKRVTIVGAGTAGLATAKALAEKGISSTIVAPASEISDLQGNWPLELGQSTPIVYGGTLRRLGLHEEDYADRAYRTNRFRSFGPHNPLAWLSLVALRIGYNFPLTLGYKKYLLDPTAIRRRLFSDLNKYAPSKDANPERATVTIVEGRVTDVVMDNRRITGVRIMDKAGEREVTSDLVIDASGRRAIVADRIQKQQPNKVVTRRRDHNGSLIGVYVSGDSTLGQEFPTTGRANIRMLPGGLIAYFGPVANADSSATNGFFIEGNPDTIKQAINRVRKKAGAQPMRQGNRILESISLLTQGSDFERIVEHVTDVATSVEFHHKATVSHSPRKTDGVIFVGDAQLAVNPEFAAGFRHISYDIRRLIRALGKANNLERAVKRYNKKSAFVGSVRLRISGLYHKAILLGHALLGTNIPPKWA